VINLVTIESDGVTDIWGANSTLQCLFFRLRKSPLLVAASPCAKFDPGTTGNKIGGGETGSTCA